MPEQNGKNGKIGKNAKKNSDINSPKAKKTSTTAEPAMNAADHPPPLSNPSSPSAAEQSKTNQTVFFTGLRPPPLSSSSTAVAASSPTVTTPAAMPPLVNKADIRKVKELGKGAFGTVYQGIYQGKEVAIKEMILDIDPAKVIQEVIKELEENTKEPGKIADELKKISQELGKRALLLEKIQKESPGKSAKELKKIAAWLKDIKEPKEIIDGLETNANKLINTANTIEKKLKELEDEVRLMSRIRSQFTVGAKGYSLNPPLIIMEMMPSSLPQVIKKQNSMMNVPSNRVAILKEKHRLVSEIAHGLSNMHHEHARILHLDLKPDNILIDHNNTVRITDFGLSRAKVKTKLSAKHSALYMVIEEDLGTMAYLAPELISFDAAKHYSTACDVYSFGTVVWEIYSGKKPFDGIEGNDLLEIRYNKTALPRPDNCPDEIWNLIQHCWTEDPKKRPTIDLIIRYLNNPKTVDLSEVVPLAITPAVPSHPTPTAASFLTAASGSTPSVVGAKDEADANKKKDSNGSPSKLKKK